jgi:hypothetical protein
MNKYAELFALSISAASVFVLLLIHLQIALYGRMEGTEPNVWVIAWEVLVWAIGLIVVAVYAKERLVSTWAHPGRSGP